MPPPHRHRGAPTGSASNSGADNGAWIDAAVLRVDRNLRELSELTAAGREIPMALRLRLRARRDQARGTERAVAAIDLLFKTAGGHSPRRGNPVERAWRDAHAGSVHVANDVERALAMCGRGAFGLAVEDHLVGVAVEGNRV